MENKKCEQTSYDGNNINEQKKDEEIKKIISDVIDTGVEDINGFIERFDKIYKDEYRHKYSEILEILMKNEDESLDYLVANMDILKEHIFNGTYTFRNSFLKLYDHIMLEVTRIRLYHDYEKRENLIEDKIDTTKNELEQYRDLYYNLYGDIKNFNDQLQNSNAQFISILGIFSAVVMVFFGGLSMLGNILSTINKASNIRIVFMASLTGIIIFNVIFLLCYFIAKILDKNIATNDLNKLHENCWKWDNNTGEYIENPKNIKKYRRILKSPFIRLKIRYPIVFWFNITMFSMMFICFVFWILKQNKSNVYTFIGYFINRFANLLKFNNINLK